MEYPKANDGVKESNAALEVEIREVWADNLEAEMANIREMVDEHCYVAMVRIVFVPAGLLDTPGVAPCRTDCPPSILLTPFPACLAMSIYRLLANFLSRTPSFPVWLHVQSGRSKAQQTTSTRRCDAT